VGHAYKNFIFGTKRLNYNQSLWKQITAQRNSVSHRNSK